MNTTLATLTAALAGRYTIDREIGAGGMATVYLAHDVRHKRNVAVKVLNAELGAVLGAGRFLAEIQVTANLQHPNLLPLFDSGEAGGLLFYVMPYVEGESLRARLKREKQLPIDEALRIATAIAGALDYAHRHKVIHRDLKPENVLMHEGQPLIADFGIALAVSNAGGERVTQTGISLGTPHYMSPEQATGDRVVDGRTDIYSLGAMTYEMLVGDPPHNASTAQSIIAKVLTEKPSSIRISRPNVPVQVDAAVMRALEKLAADRFGTAAEFGDALRGKGATTISAAFPAAYALPRFRLRAREAAAWTLVVALASAAGWQMTRPQIEPQVIRANFDLPRGAKVQDVLVGTTIAISPDGKMIAFTSFGLGNWRMYVRRVNELAAREISSATGRNLTFSHDSRWLAYSEGNEIKKISVDGGQTSTITTTSGRVPYGLAWSAADSIYIGGFSGLTAVPSNGGANRQVWPDSAGFARVGQRWPVVLPGDRGILFTGANSSSQTGILTVLDKRTGKLTELGLPVAAPLGVVDDHLVYVAPTGELMAVRFDMKRLRPVGEAVQLDDGVLVDPTQGVKASLSRSGSLVFLRGRAQLQAVLFNPRNGSQLPVMPDVGSFLNPRLSPDGRRMAITVVGTASTDIWIYDLRDNTFARLTTEGSNVRAEWSPDGKYVIFVSTREGKPPGIWRQPADGSGPAELFYQPDFEPFEALMSPDSKWLLYRTAPGAKFSRDIFAVSLTGERKVEPVVTSAFTETMPRLSPDGKWLAYQANESGPFQVYVRPFPARGGRVQVSDKMGTEPVWGRSGNVLYYRGENGEVIEVSVTTGERFSIGKRRTVVIGDFLTDASHVNYDVTSDGRFVMLKRAGAESQTIVVHNWARELRETTARRP